MTKPFRPDQLDRLPPTWRASVIDGLPDAIDAVAAAAPTAHRFLRRQWYAAALAAYGGVARTVVVGSEAGPGIALPLVASGPRWLGAASVPGCYWPFRGFPAATDDPGAWAALVDALAGTVTALRVGPVFADDPGLALLVAAARRRGWTALPRFLAERFVLDLAAEGWPRGSTLRKNRFHEKHLAAHGALEWSLAEGCEVAAQEAMSAVERASWIVTRTDGSDAKFTAEGHGAFWRAAVRDPVLAAMFRVALLRVDHEPVAFSFDIAAGPVRYAIANSYDPRFAKHSPGKLLQYRNLVAAAADGTRTVDWGAGDVGYKQTIGAVRGGDIQDWLLLRPGWPARLGGLLRRWWR